MRSISIFLACALCASILLMGCGGTGSPAPATPTTAAATSTPTSAAPAENSPTTAPAGPTAVPALNEAPQQMVWLAEGARAEGIASAGPLLIAKQGATLFPFQPDPLQAEPSVTLNIPGQVLFLAPDAQSAIARGADGSMGVYDLTGRLRFSFDEPNPYFAAFTEDGKTITVNTAGTFGILVYDAETGQRLKTLTGFETAAPVYGGGLAPGGKTAYWIARARLQLQDVASGQMGVAFSYEDFIEAMAFSPDGERLALSVSGKIYLYAVPDGKALAQITRSEAVNALRFSPDGRLLAAGYGPGVQVWDGNTLAPVRSFPGPNAFTGQVSFSPDGKYLAAAHEGGQISVFRVNE